ncbi:hypothetical protein SELR_14570 [Selenomonas ruminantium subsp. lactilytica TAM6421]|uniref:DUF1902 domain-containing protein n=1 Tax=Selenomonas ruminantium subsp. lactilytica (strain NBRC 103574 / TAM6421) TaxID=927704 RepID=I0GQX8_SELRL|nr:DUF1902 domain-containing protein [Selenomonas ruminantium]BAL83165.1 hypothetical protein SELR_14570 [Selenomonas ruminantium subsp. lactilytica TAM6421]
MKFYGENYYKHAEYTVNLIWDDAANVWVAICDDIPLALEAESLDELINRISVTAPEIIESNQHLLPSK